MTRNEMVQRAQDWVDAADGEEGFEGDTRCGCEPVHQAVRLFYVAKISVLGAAQDAATMGPVDIPITFHDDRTFEGQGTFPFRGAGADRGCTTGSQGQMVIKLTGSAVEEAGNNRMHIDVEEVTPTTGSTAVQCPMFSGMRPIKGGSLPPPHLDLLGLVGEEKRTIVPLPSPIAVANLCGKIIDLDPKVAGITPNPPQCPKMK
jgi:hypothetical protein